MRFFDIKTNIIPRVDPNCESISQSLNLLKEFKGRNITKICSSPNYFDIGEIEIQNIIIDIQKEASKLEDFEIPEIYTSVMHPINLDLIEIKNIRSINNSRFLLCKFPTFGIPVNYSDKLRYLVNNNYIPIISNFSHCDLNKYQKVIQEIFEIGCFFDLDINDFFEYKNKYSTRSIKFMESQQSIITVSGFNKLDDMDKGFERFSRITKINQKKLKEVYCWDNPNLIISS
tara:strand:- start:398 stop:1087 length:690 start_codon:yes stop_codon:yes gene_type:complete